MPSPTKNTQKPKLSRKILADENVFFFDHVHLRGDLPRWLRPIRFKMISGWGKVPKNSEEMLTAELKTFRLSGQDGDIASTSRWSLKPAAGIKGYSIKESFGEDKLAIKREEQLDDCLRVRKLAISHRQRNELEPPWVSLLQAEFFRTYTEVHGTPDDYRDLFDRWEVHANILWNECLRRKDSTGQVRTGPKPDLTYSFPIIDPACKIPRSFRCDPRVKYFMLPVLSQLRKSSRGSAISPTKSALLNWDPNKLKALGAANLTCFPWAVVEVKTSPWNGNKAEFCYCQAANASAEALIMREKLAERVPEPSNEALVIFSFTCVGPTVRLWLTFRDSSSHKIEMRCIWATSLELTWGVYILREVVANMRNWVYDRVKPEICRWIAYVRLHPDGDQLKQRKRAKSLEQRNERVSNAPSPSPRRTSRSKITPELSRGNTVPRRARSPSPPSQQLAQLTFRIREVEESDEDDSERDAGGSDDEGSYAPSDAATSDDDGYTTVEEENYDTSTDEDEPDEGYSSDRFYKTLHRPRCVN